ncbi:MAG TPA: VOC family protein [Nitrososphaeraceae archaeon]|nr:VOC family protein [Nitrososphaeraceae archaeon]
MTNMTANVKPISDGYHTITPYIIIKDAERAIEFYKKSFNAEERHRMYGPDNKTIMHAEIIIEDSAIMLSEESQEMKCFSPQSVGRNPVWLYVYVKDVDSTFNQAVSEGATVLEPVNDAFWGDRVGSLKDPFGYQWSIATHKKDLSAEEIKKAAEGFCAEMSKKKAT